MASEGGGSAWIEGRMVVHVRGTKSQTVNICAEGNKRGQYEFRYVLPIEVDVSVDSLSELADLESLHAWLQERDGVVSRSDFTPGSRLSPLVPFEREGDEWLAPARAAVERAFTTLVEQFLENPYLHRVEGSLHAHLYALLKQEPALAGTAALAQGSHATQLVHKEWPEARRATGLEERSPRGLFDFAILAPNQLRKTDLEQFLQGTVAASIAIEIGLDYGLGHLRGDEEKLRLSGVPAPYLLHLSRVGLRTQAELEDLVCSLGDPFRVAYAHLDPKTGRVRYKHLSATTITQVQREG